MPLLFDKLDNKSFTAFVDTLKQGIEGSDRVPTNLDASRESLLPKVPGWNVFDEPLELSESENDRMKLTFNLSMWKKWKLTSEC